jgi:hypothetical protein
VQEYYDYAGVMKYMESNGIVPSKAENMHDDPIISLNMFITDPRTIRYSQRVKSGKASINGVSLADSAKSVALAKQIVAFRTEKTVEAINKSIANKGTLPAPPRPARP